MRVRYSISQLLKKSYGYNKNLIPFFFFYIYVYFSKSFMRYFTRALFEIFWFLHVLTVLGLKISILMKHE